MSTGQQNTGVCFSIWGCATNQRYMVHVVRYCSFMPQPWFPAVQDLPCCIVELLLGICLWCHLVISSYVLLCLPGQGHLGMLYKEKYMCFEVAGTFYQLLLIYHIWQIIHENGCEVLGYIIQQESVDAMCRFCGDISNICDAGLFLFRTMHFDRVSSEYIDT